MQLTIKSNIKLHDDSILLLLQSCKTRFHEPVNHLLEIQLVLISRKDRQFDGWCNLHSENKNNILSYLNDLHAVLNRQVGQTKSGHFSH